MIWKGDDINDEDIVESGDEESRHVDDEVEGGVDDVEVGDAEAAAEAKVKKLKAELEQAKEESRQNLDGWQRAKADYVNALRRFEDDKKNERQKGVQEATGALLPAFDAIERAKEHGEVPAGFTAIIKQLEAAFANLGLTPIGTVGEAFDPAIHEALGQDPVDSAEMDEKVTLVFEKGWKQGDPSNPSGQARVIRPAKVKVGKFEG